MEIAGLAAIEERAYRALVRLPAVCADELAEILDVRVDEITKVLGALEEQGLVSQGPDSQYRAIAPDRAFGPLLQRHQQELAAVQSAIGLLTDEYRGRGAAGLVEVVHGAAAVGRQVDRLQQAARTEVLALVKRDGVRPSIGPAHRAILEAPHETIAGAQARVLPELPLTMMLVDRDSAIVPIAAVPAGGAAVHNADDAAALLVQASSLLDALVALFERLWASAAPLVVDAADRSGPSASDLHLLSLLIAGLTDHAIAAQLGMSTRTVQRRIRVLLETAGVQTRLQLVWHAAQRGWL